MQVNERIRRAQNRTRLPDLDRAFDDPRAMLETRVEWRGAGESRHTGTTQPEGTRTPHHYGAGI
jgi:hypothetical protein